MKIEKAIGISDAKIQFVSLVDKAANKRRFLITKAENGSAQFSTVGKILKVDDGAHYITGIVYEPLVEDAHGNFMTEDEIRKSAYWFAKNSDKVDLQHSFEPVSGVSVVENYVAPSDMTIADQPIAKGTWIMTVEVNNSEVWDKVQKGEVTGFSMGGVGKYSETETELPATVEKRSVFKKLAELFGFDVVEKGVVKDKYKRKSKYDNFWAAVNSLREALSHYNWETDYDEFTTDDTIIREALQDFSDIIQDMLTEPNLMKALSVGAPVEKAGKKISGKNRSTLQTIYESLGKLLEECSEDSKEELELTKAEVQALVDESIKKALENKSPTEKAEAAKTEPAPTVPSEVTAETVQKMINDAIQKAFTPAELIAEPAPVEKSLTAEDVQAMITAAITKSLEPVLKARGVSSNLNEEAPIEKNDEPHYLAGIL